MMYVEKTGLHSSKISIDELNSLIYYAKLNNFISLNDSYTSKIDTTKDGIVSEETISDLQSKIISLKIDGTRKIVKNYFGGPTWLTLFENKIDSTINVRKWVGR